MIEKINLTDKLSRFQDYWNPKIIGELNGQFVKLVKFAGDFVWHKHDKEDELFYVIEGSFKMELRDKSIELNEGELIIIPRGVEHRPRATKEVRVMLFEPASTLNTGDVQSDLTVDRLDKI